MVPRGSDLQGRQTEGPRMLFFAPICALVHTVALRALVSNKNPSFLHRGCVFQASENGPHCGHVDSAERPEFLPGEKRLNSWGGKGSQYTPLNPPTHTHKLCPREAKAMVIADPRNLPGIVLAPQTSHRISAIALFTTKGQSTVCLSVSSDSTHHSGQRP